MFSERLYSPMISRIPPEENAVRGLVERSAVFTIVVKLAL